MNEGRGRWKFEGGNEVGGGEGGRGRVMGVVITRHLLIKILRQGYKCGVLQRVHLLTHA